MLPGSCFPTLVASLMAYCILDLRVYDADYVEWPRGIAPLGSHRTVRDSLPSHGSCRSTNLWLVLTNVRTCQARSV